jgi:hypothetical protein
MYLCYLFLWFALGGRHGQDNIPTMSTGMHESTHVSLRQSLLVQDGRHEVCCYHHVQTVLQSPLPVFGQDTVGTVFGGHGGLRL